MADLNPFAGLISQVLAYRPPAQKGKSTIDPYQRILAVQRMAQGERSSDIARELWVTKDSVESWWRKARIEAEGARHG